MTNNVWNEAGPPWGAATPPDAQLHRLIVDERAGRLGPLLPFWGHTPWGDQVGPWVLSQWWEGHPFEIGGVRVPTAEHAMMLGKARVMGDVEIQDRILAAPTPKEAKALGRQVQNWDQARWDRMCYDVVVRVSRAKFSQHEELRAYLLSTAPAVIVEASPYDRIWGIGLGPTDAKAQTPSSWRGQNLLGFALTQVRDEMLLAS